MAKISVPENTPRTARGWVIYVRSAVIRSMPEIYTSGQLVLGKIMLKFPSTLVLISVFKQGVFSSVCGRRFAGIIKFVKFPPKLQRTFGRARESAVRGL